MKTLVNYFSVFAIVCWFFLVIKSSHADTSYMWEGYWASSEKYCLNSNQELMAFGFFADRIENWEADCKLVSIEEDLIHTKNANYDILNLSCKSKDKGVYTQEIRLAINSEGKLLLVWPSGVGFKLSRCEIKVSH